MYVLINLAIIPAITLLFYIYFRDKYEKEPIRLLITAFIFGMYITVPIILIENVMLRQMPILSNFFEAVYESFFIASLVEEGVKFMFLYFLFWKNKNLNEPFDGIVYAAFISLGFAMIENIFYVFDFNLGGYKTAFYRGLISLPMHLVFAIQMGFYFAIAKFNRAKKNKYLFKAFFLSFRYHGLYDLILSISSNFYLIIFYPFILYSFYNSLKKINKHLEISPFKEEYFKKRMKKNQI